MDRRRYTDDQLSEAVAGSRSWREVLRTLGLAGTSASAIRSARRHAERLGLDTSHFTGRRRWTDHELAEAVASSRSWTQVLDRLGLAGGSSTSALKGHALRLGLDTSGLGVVAASAGPILRPQEENLARSGALLAATWFSMSGYDVSWPLEPSRYDLVVGRAGSLLRIQVKTTRARKGGSWVASVASSSLAGRVYDPEDLDHFFVVDGDLACYLVPVGAVAGQHTISLSSYARFLVGSVAFSPPEGSADGGPT